MLPRVAIVDPELTVDVPRDVTATTGLDALTQLIEAFVSVRANPMTDALCAAGIPRAAAALPRAHRDGRDLDAREDMALASLWSGMALANAGLGAVHGFAGPLGGLFSAPHGALCAALLPHVMAANIIALRRAAKTDALARFDHAARLLTGSAHAKADDGVVWVRALCEDLAIPTLGALGIAASDIDRIVPHARRASSMKGNPIALGDAELSAILVEAM
jgi:alcohol dehydrogenase class IV